MNVLKKKTTTTKQKRLVEALVMGTCTDNKCFMENKKSWILPYSKFEPAHDKNYNKTCAISEDSDQPAHPRSLIRVFADRMWLLQPADYPKRAKKNSCHTGWMYRLILDFAGHTGLIDHIGLVVCWLIL